MIAGIDFSSRFVDVVLLDEDTDRATWHRFALEGADAFDRARDVARVVPGRAMSFWDDVLAVGIEEPMMRGGGMSSAYSLYRVQGAVLACIPPSRLVQPWKPSSWRKAVGLPGNCPKEHVYDFVYGLHDHGGIWPFDAADAYAIARATRSLVQQKEAAA